ncbi:dienelactone hydrolase [Xylaria bambusicola]|uniref:dienelactone hydrolase n=1 Tax=Xylaria bambusicola TaxID=326684 RepID=UPI0020087E65|nr:dienelactone hydrolase [Xylaria bambusicola]KAI0525518.1 dienelactone hydrolase [Xylaria bambusicola]
MSFTSCCLKTFTWGGTPTGKEVKLANNDAYVTGDNKDAAVLIIHDIFGWKYPNVRLLADHYAREANVTVYVPDFFDGWVVDWSLVETNQFDKIDLAALAAENSREIRGPEMVACAKALKSEHGFKRLASIGFCYGGWGVCYLASKERGEKLVDTVTMAHPSWLVEEDIANLTVPVQILAPEFDQAFTPELKSYTFKTLLELNLPFNYVHYPGIVHGALVRGSDEVPKEREAMAAAKNSAVTWFKQQLH